MMHVAEQKNIVLVGFMGTGKTTVGRLLEERTGLELVDMDALIVERAGKSINEIFADDGEPAFRAMERALSQELSKRRGLIISTGGGIVLNAANLTDYGQSGLVVCLLASTDEILSRVQHDDDRPLLAGDKLDKIVQLYASRKELYEAVEHSVKTDGLSPAEVADRIITLYKEINS